MRYASIYSPLLGAQSAEVEIGEGREKDIFDILPKRCTFVGLLGLSAANCHAV
jgi:hypothetical protein